VDLVDRILAGRQLDLADLVGGVVDEPAPPAPKIVGKASDRYMTSSEVLNLVGVQWPEGIDLDPCWDPESLVVARQTMDIRHGEDGSLLPWPSGSRVFINPPYSDPGPWLSRAAQHGAAGGEVLALVDASVSTKAWGKSVYPFAAICFLSPRPKFRHAGSTKWTHHTKDSAILYFGSNRSEFGKVWAPRGELVSSVRLLDCPAPDLSRKP
jgi:hypothetical protein